MKLLQHTTYLLFCLVATAQLATGQETIVAYDTTNPNGTNGAPSPNLPAADIASGIVASDLSRGAGLIPNMGVTFNSSDWSTSNILDIASDDYIAWGWTEGFARFDLQQLSIQYDRSGSGPEQLAIAVSIDDGEFEVIHTDGNVLVSDEDAFIDLTAFTSVASAEFRLFGFDADMEGGTLDIEDLGNSRGIIVTGTLVSVPEPDTFAFLFATGLIAAMRKQRRES